MLLLSELDSLGLLDSRAERESIALSDCLWSGKQARNQVLALVYSIAQFARQATALQA